ncbi:Phosphate acyltransferase [Commensalibacter sp. Nvir]|uniref:phosphate acyltransferase PlsX n=1 Tax=Commensalibacter sp. Nvir TaxID=3069817 RepID=UPI002D34C1EF|nr:Phosphate acyltransferase [Commensalibacter sp. Nvir]
MSQEVNHITKMNFDLAIDAMGGDNAPEVIVKGLSTTAIRHPDVKILLIGDQNQLKPLLHKYPKVSSICTLRHTSIVVPMDMKPTLALKLRNSSMRMAMESVACKESRGVVSAGNSGAMLALAQIIIKTMTGILRPAMAAISPTAKGDIVMLDLGANVSCDSRNLVDFAVLGYAFAKAVLGLPKPMIGLLNVGSEEVKGNEHLKIAAEILRNSSLSDHFHGFIEGHDITAGTTDVVVTDGFTGNIALKTGEGALKLAFQLLKEVYSSSIRGKLGYLMVKPGLERMKEWLDPRRYNGAVFVGLNGVVVKSHGGADETSFASAVDVAMDMIKHGFYDEILNALAQVNPKKTFE